MNRTKVVVFVDHYYPGYKAGGPIKSVGNLIEILKNNFEFYLITRNYDWGETKTYKSIPSNELFEKDDVKYFYYSSETLNRKAIDKLIRKIQPDYIYLNSIYSFFTRSILISNKKSPFSSKVVIAPRGELQDEAVKLKYWKKKPFLLYLDKFNLVKNIYWQSTSDRETLAIRKHFGNKISIIKNLNIPENKKTNWTKIVKKPGTLNLIYISRIDKKKNLEFLPPVLKDLKKERINLDIFGACENHKYLDNLKNRFSKLPKNIVVNFRGKIQHSEVLIELSKHHFFILPTKGENFGHAIFEAMLVGKPVIISDQTPWQKLETQKIGWSLSLNKPSLWQEVIKTCINMNQKEYDDWSKSTWNFAIKYLEKTVSAENAKKIFNLDKAKNFLSSHQIK